jgi:hypothetical protein
LGLSPGTLIFSGGGGGGSGGEPPLTGDSLGGKLGGLSSSSILSVGDMDLTVFKLALEDNESLLDVSVILLLLPAFGPVGDWGVIPDETVVFFNFKLVGLLVLDASEPN